MKILSYFGHLYYGRLQIKFVCKKKKKKKKTTIEFYKLKKLHERKISLSNHILIEYYNCFFQGKNMKNKMQYFFLSFFLNSVLFCLISKTNKKFSSNSEMPEIIVFH